MPYLLHSTDQRKSFSRSVLVLAEVAQGDEGTEVAVIMNDLTATAFFL